MLFDVSFSNNRKNCEVVDLKKINFLKSYKNKPKSINTSDEDINKKNIEKKCLEPTRDLLAPIVVYVLW